MNIRKSTAADWPAVRESYELGIATDLSTFENHALTWDDWNTRHLQACRYIAEVGRHIAGWVALSPVSGRCVYGGVAEVSIYIHPDFQGQGIGKFLLLQAIEASEKAGIWSMYGRHVS